jgi:hypothetical protein
LRDQNPVNLGDLNSPDLPIGDSLEMNNSFGVEARDTTPNNPESGPNRIVFINESFNANNRRRTSNGNRNLPRLADLNNERLQLHRNIRRRLPRNPNPRSQLRALQMRNNMENRRDSEMFGSNPFRNIPRRPNQVQNRPSRPNRPILLNNLRNRLNSERRRESSLDALDALDLEFTSEEIIQPPRTRENNRSREVTFMELGNSLEDDNEPIHINPPRNIGLLQNLSRIQRAREELRNQMHDINHALPIRRITSNHRVLDRDLERTLERGMERETRRDLERERDRRNFIAGHLFSMDSTDSMDLINGLPRSFFTRERLIGMKRNRFKPMEESEGAIKKVLDKNKEFFENVSIKKIRERKNNKDIKEEQKEGKGVCAKRISQEVRKTKTFSK